MEKNRIRARNRRRRLAEALNRQARELRKQNPERFRAYSRRWYQKNKRSRQDYSKRPIVKIAKTLRGRIREYLGVKNSRSGRFGTLLGCTSEELRQHLQGQFEPWMTWENYGKRWHVDHIIPCSRFDLMNPEHQKICFHYRNLQPLSVRENLAKHNLITEPQISLRF